VSQKRLVEDFRAFLEENGMTRETINRFIFLKRSENADMKKVMRAMVDYAWSIRDEYLMSETVLLIDAAGVMNKLFEVTKELSGPDVWQEVFGGVEMPQIGWTINEMNDFTVLIDRKYLNAAPKEDYERACEIVAHCFGGWHRDGRKTFLSIKNIDAFCKKLCDDLIKELERCRDTGDLYFNQKIDDAVIGYMKANPYAVRRGSKIVVTKIPFRAKEYLAETDNKMKRYYACHCPWARESILNEADTVSPSFCHCSLGLEKKDFETALGRELDGRIVSTVLEKDSLKCVFEIDIPEDILEMYT